MVTREVEVASVAPDGRKDNFVIVATYLPLRSVRSIIPFMRLSNKIEASMRSSQGIIRYALKTDMPRKRFWTVSVWTNRSDMALFSRSEPHRTAMRKFFEWGTDKACIAEWTSPDGKIDWNEAEARLRKPAFHYKYDARKRLVHAAGSDSITKGPQEEERS